MKLRTEQANPASRQIDQLPTIDMLRIINAEDAKVAAAVAATLPEIARAVDACAAALAGGGRLIYVGAGTSGRLGILDAVECPPTFSTAPELVQGFIAGGAGAIMQAVEGAEDEPERARQDLTQARLTSADVVCGIAASGRTPYVIGALDYARQVGARRIAIACNVASPIAARADISISVDVGPEVITGSTRMKAGSAQKMIFNMLSTGTMIRLGKVYGNLMVDVKVSNQKLLGRASRLVQRLTGVDESAALHLLAQANNEVKTAVVMERLGVDGAAARTMLDQANGQLRALIGDVDF